jgi:hypothetical protein
MLNAEPSTEMMAWSRLAQMIFNSRFYAYHLYSYVSASKYKFKSVALAREDYWKAELHHQPGKGFRLDEIVSLFGTNGFSADIFRLVDRKGMRLRPTWQLSLLLVLSGQNPWNEKYAPFSILARK